MTQRTPPQKVKDLKMSGAKKRRDAMMAKFTPSGQFAQEQNVQCKNCSHTGRDHLAMGSHPCTKDGCMTFVPTQGGG
jgi:hypothetical protein